MSVVQPPASGFQLGNKLYDGMKFFVQIVMPALGALYASLAQIWGFPAVQGVVGTLAAVALFLGVLMRLSSSNFTAPLATRTPDGAFVVTTLEDGRKNVRLDFEQDPSSLINGRILTFQVQDNDQPTPSVGDSTVSPLNDNVSDPDAPREENLS